MKLASYQDGSRDGQLIVVSRDLSTAHYASGIAHRLQQALDDWNFIAPQLQDVYHALNQGRARHAFAFDPQQCLAPLPRAHTWLRAHAYAARSAALQAVVAEALPDELATGLSAAAADDLHAPHSPLCVADTAWGADFGGGLAAVTADVPQAATPEQGQDAVRLLLLVNDWALRHGAAAGLSAWQCRPALALGPVAITPDELGPAWQDGRVHLPLQVSLNGRRVGLCDAGGMASSFGELIAQASRTRRLRAGSVLSAGVVAPPGDSAAPSQKGYSSLADRRALEVLRDGRAKTRYLQWGDTVRLEMKGGRAGESLFGAIAQTLQAFGSATPSPPPAPEAAPDTTGPHTPPNAADTADTDKPQNRP